MGIIKKLAMFLVFSVMYVGLCIGYASLSSSLTIIGDVSAEEYIGVFIKNVVIQSSNNADISLSSINSYTDTIVNSTLELGDRADSSITMQIIVYNNTNETYGYNATKYALGESTYDNNDIVFELNDLRKKDPIESEQELTFTVTFSYLDNTVASDKILNSIIEYEFLPIDEIIEDDGGTAAKDVLGRFEEILNTEEENKKLVDQMKLQEENDRFSDDYIGNVLGTTEDDLAVINELFPDKLNININGTDTEVKIMIKEEDIDGDGIAEMTIYMTTDPLSQSGSWFSRNYVVVYACAYKVIDGVWVKATDMHAGTAAVNGYDGSYTGTGSFDTDSWRYDQNGDGDRNNNERNMTIGTMIY